MAIRFFRTHQRLLPTSNCKFLHLDRPNRCWPKCRTRWDSEVCRIPNIVAGCEESGAHNKDTLLRKIRRRVLLLSQTVFSRKTQWTQSNSGHGRTARETWEASPTKVETFSNFSCPQSHTCSGAGAALTLLPPIRCLIPRCRTLSAKSPGKRAVFDFAFSGPLSFRATHPACAFGG